MQNENVRAWLSSLPQTNAHAHLITGAGCSEGALAAAALLLCRKPEEGQACRMCQACHWFAARTHPDFLHIGTHDGEKTIKIRSIRQMRDEVALAPRLGRKVIWIEEAQRMSEEAQNALLRTLEEPPPNVVFLLSGQEDGLLPTVRSRCAIFRMGTGKIADSELQSEAERLLGLLFSGNVQELANQYNEKKAVLSRIFGLQAELLRDAVAFALDAPLLRESSRNFTAKLSSGHNISMLNAGIVRLLEAQKRLTQNANIGLTIDFVLIGLEGFFCNA